MQANFNKQFGFLFHAKIGNPIIVTFLKAYYSKAK